MVIVEMRKSSFFCVKIETTIISLTTGCYLLLTIYIPPDSRKVINSLFEVFICFVTLFKHQRQVCLAIVNLVISQKLLLTLNTSRSTMLSYRQWRGGLKEGVELVSGV